MEELMKLGAYPLKGLVRRLLQDKTTKQNIRFASDCYANYRGDSQMTEDALPGMGIQPRAYKVASERAERTRKRAEVFTPAWIVNRMNNQCDAEWFGRQDVFNRQNNQRWEPVRKPIAFPKGKNWKQYVDSRRLELACGEAPYIVSRYDAATGENIPIENRIGILDRKLRIVSENAADEAEWFKWAFRAFQSVYGYEYQGDNLLIARINLLYTLAEYVEAKWNRRATQKELKKFLNVICWNFWQMDGVEDVPPYGNPNGDAAQLLLFAEEASTADVGAGFCKIHDWRARISRSFKSLKDDGKGMKFDFVIGNPPYQDTTLGENATYAPPIYHLFMESAYAVSERAALIHPARFLFDAGSTPKNWNRKMLSDAHFRILLYEPDSSKLFSNTDIKGGVAISYRDAVMDYGAIETFLPYGEMRSVLAKIRKHPLFESMRELVVTRTAYRLTEQMHREHPEAIGLLSEGHAYDMATNIFERLPQIFSDEKPDDAFAYIKILGREKNKRTFKFIRKDYVNTVCNLFSYKVLMPKALGSGAFGETLPELIIGFPAVGSTETFISIGSFCSESEAENARKYIKTKFCRALLDILKTTQDITPEKWKYVPVQKFTADSDIDWSRSVSQIDRQLYAKYGLTKAEIDFIETHVKKMA